MNNKKNKKYNFRVRFHSGIQMILTLILVLSGIFFHSCRQEDEIVITMGEPVSLSLSDSNLVLSQKQAGSNALKISWTRGTNKGTGSSISYTLEIDKVGNDFSSSKIYDLGKGVFEKNFSHSELNVLVRDFWGIDPGVSTDFETRVIADITLEEVEDDVTEVKTFSVTPYKPVSDVLYIVGDASPNGWNISNAIPLSPMSSTPWIFVYQGQLSPGSFKFSVSQDDCWCRDFYTKDPSNEGIMVYNEGGSGDDIQWQIEQSGVYKIVANLIDLTIGVEKVEGSSFSNLYIVGDASPGGWNIGSPEAFTQDPDDSFIFTYEAHLSPGEFKISTFTGDWCDGEWINPSQADQSLNATDFIVTQGCDGPDNKWRVTEETEGRYQITVNLYTRKITIKKIDLHIVGDGGPNGWNINNPEPMQYANGIFTFTGDLGTNNPTGEFKFSKFTGDWCDGDWINSATPNQPLSNTDFIITNGCAGPDNKWKLQDGDAGTYVITINLDTEEMTITRQ